MTTVNDARIAQRAHEIWEKEGKPHGRDREHWLQAVAELSSGKAAPAPKAAAAKPVPAVKPAAPKPAAPVAVVAAAAKPKAAVTAPARTKTAPAKKK